MSVSVSGGGSVGSNRVRYVAEGKLAPNEGSIRQLYSRDKNDLGYQAASAILARQGELKNGDIFEIIVSLKDEQSYMNFGTDAESRMAGMEKLVRTGTDRILANIKCRTDYIFGIHLNTNNPHAHVIIPKAMIDVETNQPRLVKGFDGKWFGNDKSKTSRLSKPFNDALESLTNVSPAQFVRAEQTPTHAPLVMPERAHSQSQIIKSTDYLIEVRGINPETIEQLIDSNALYLSRASDPVFVRRNSKGEISGYDARYAEGGEGNFYIGDIETANRFVIVSNPIEAASLYDIANGQRDLSRVCFIVAQTPDAALIQHMTERNESEPVRIIDARTTGTEKELADPLENLKSNFNKIVQGGSAIPECVPYRPKQRYGKTWNEQLIQMHLAGEIAAFDERDAPAQTVAHVLANQPETNTAEVRAQSEPENAETSRANTEDDAVSVADLMLTYEGHINLNGQHVGSYATELMDGREVLTTLEIAPDQRRRGIALAALESLYSGKEFYALTPQTGQALNLLSSYGEIENLEDDTCRVTPYRRDFEAGIQEQSVSGAPINDEITESKTTELREDDRNELPPLTDSQIEEEKKERQPTAKDVIKTRTEAMHELTKQLRELPLEEVARTLGLTKMNRAGENVYTNNQNIRVKVDGQLFSNRYFKDGRDEFEGGRGAIDFVRYVTGDDDFQKARNYLKDNFSAGLIRTVARETEAIPTEKVHRDREPLDIMPPNARKLPVVRDYLTNVRGLSPTVVDACISEGLLYANSFGSCQFLHRSLDGIVNGATWRATYGTKRGNAPGTDKLNGWFYIGDIQNARHFVFTEAPIEALSYVQLHQHELTGKCVISTAGTGGISEIVKYISRISDENTRVTIAYNNLDFSKVGGKQGWKGTIKICDALHEAGYKGLVNSYLPEGEDLNDEVLIRRDEMRSDADKDHVRLEIESLTERSEKSEISPSVFNEAAETISDTANSEAAPVKLSDTKENNDEPNTSEHHGNHGEPSADETGMGANGETVHGGIAPDRDKENERPRIGEPERSGGGELRSSASTFIERSQAVSNGAGVGRIGVTMPAGTLGLGTGDDGSRSERNNARVAETDVEEKQTSTSVEPAVEVIDAPVDSLGRHFYFRNEEGEEELYRPENWPEIDIDRFGQSREYSYECNSPEILLDTALEERISWWREIEALQENIASGIEPRSQKKLSGARLEREQKNWQRSLQGNKDALETQADFIASAMGEPVGKAFAERAAAQDESTRPVTAISEPDAPVALNESSAAGKEATQSESLKQSNLSRSKIRQDEEQILDFKIIAQASATTLRTSRGSAEQRETSVREYVDNHIERGFIHLQKSHGKTRETRNKITYYLTNPQSNKFAALPAGEAANYALWRIANPKRSREHLAAFDTQKLNSSKEEKSIVEEPKPSSWIPVKPTRFVGQPSLFDRAETSPDTLITHSRREIIENVVHAVKEELIEGRPVETEINDEGITLISPEQIKAEDKGIRIENERNESIEISVETAEELAKRVGVVSPGEHLSAVLTAGLSGNAGQISGDALREYDLSRDHLEAATEELADIAQSQAFARLRRTNALDPLKASADEYWSAQAERARADDIIIGHGAEVHGNFVRGKLFNVSQAIESISKSDLSFRLDAVTERDEIVLARTEGLKTWEMMRDEYMARRHVEDIAAYRNAVARNKRELETIRAARPNANNLTTRDLERQIISWERVLADPEVHLARKQKSFEQTYAAAVSKAISKGERVAEEIIAQSDDFRTAQTNRARYEKGWRTSFANQSAAVNDSMQDTRGYKVKRQDGREISADQIAEIERGMDEVESIIGIHRELLRTGNVTIAHTSGKYPFLNDAAGVYHPSERTITIGIHSHITGGRIPSLAHEWAHWLDHEAGSIEKVSVTEWRKRGKSFDVHYLSEGDYHGRFQILEEPAGRRLFRDARDTMTDTYRVSKLLSQKSKDLKTDEDRITHELVKVRLGAYWQRPREIFARLVEQYVSTNLADSGASENFYSVSRDYTEQPGYWSKDAFARLMPRIEVELARRMEIVQAALTPAAARLMRGEPTTEQLESVAVINAEELADEVILDAQVEAPLRESGDEVKTDSDFIDAAGEKQNLIVEPDALSVQAQPYGLTETQILARAVLIEDGEKIAYRDSETNAYHVRHLYADGVTRTSGALSAIEALREVEAFDLIAQLDESSRAAEPEASVVATADSIVDHNANALTIGEHILILGTTNSPAAHATIVNIAEDKTVEARMDFMLTPETADRAVISGLLDPKSHLSLSEQDASDVHLFLPLALQSDERIVRLDKDMLDAAVYETDLDSVEEYGFALAEMSERIAEARNEGIGQVTEQKFFNRLREEYEGMQARIAVYEETRPEVQILSEAQTKDIEHRAAVLIEENDQEPQQQNFTSLVVPAWMMTRDEYYGQEARGFGRRDLHNDGLLTEPVENADYARYISLAPQDHFKMYSYETADIADSDDYETALEITEEALNIAGSSGNNTKQINALRESINKAGGKFSGITLAESKELNLEYAARMCGYDGLRLLPNEEAASPSLVHIWNLQHVHEIGEVNHRLIVEQAITEGIKVPERVLADYPDMAEIVSESRRATTNKTSDSNLDEAAESGRFVLEFESDADAVRIVEAVKLEVKSKVSTDDLQRYVRGDAPYYTERGLWSAVYAANKDNPAFINNKELARYVNDVLPDAVAREANAQTDSKNRRHFDFDKFFNQFGVSKTQDAGIGLQDSVKANVEQNKAKEPVHLDADVDLASTSDNSARANPASSVQNIETAAEEKEGLLNSGAHIIINPSNTVGVMGAGASKAIADKWPSIAEDFREVCRARPGIIPFQIGFIHSATAPSGEVIAHLPTKADWRNPSRIEFIEKGLGALSNHLRTGKLNEVIERVRAQGETPKINMPLLGTGKGGLNPEQVSSLIKERMTPVCSDLRLELHVFNQAGPLFTINERGSLEISNQAPASTEPATQVVAGNRAEAERIAHETSKASAQEVLDATPYINGMRTVVFDITGEGERLIPETERHVEKIAKRLRELNPAIHTEVAPKTAKYISRSIETGIYETMLAPNNKTARAVFEELTGVELPKTEKGTREFFEMRGAHPFQVIGNSNEIAVGYEFDSTMAAQPNAAPLEDLVRDQMFESLAYSPELFLATPLLSEKYKTDNKAILVEELAAIVAAGEGHKFGLTNAQGASYLSQWFESIATKNGDLSREQFKELTDESARIRDAAYERAATDREYNERFIKFSASAQGRELAGLDGSVEGGRGGWDQENVGRDEFAHVGLVPEGQRIIERPLFDLNAHELDDVVAQSSEPFYSRLERTISERMPNRASAQQIRAIITNPQAGVKADEIKWTGFDDFLNENEGHSLTKKDVNDYLALNNVQVREIMKGARAGENAIIFQQINEIDAQLHQLQREAATVLSVPNQSTAAIADLHNRLTDLQGERDKLNAKVVPELDHTKFAQYIVPGSLDGSYRELLLTLPTQGTEKQIHRGRRINELEADRQTDTDEYRKLVAEQEISAQRQEYKSHHFDEPNIIAHLRLNERMDAEGKRILFIEEVQSDWHQEGRSKGYIDKTPTPSRNALNEEYNSIAAIFRQSTELFDEQILEQRFQLIDRKWEDKSPEQFQEELFGISERITALEKEKHGWFMAQPGSKSQAELLSRKSELSNELFGNGEEVPAAPFSKTWHELAMKHALRYAAENGFDRLAWTTGEQQSERYDLSKQIDSIRYERYAVDDTYGVEAIKDDRPVIQKTVPEHELSGLVGKDVAQKIINGEGQPSIGYMKELSGLDLKVGGEGMKKFYDEMLPAYMQKYGKKWGASVSTTILINGNASALERNPTIEEITLRDERQFAVNAELFSPNGNTRGLSTRGTYDTRDEAQQHVEAIQAENQTSVHSINITPAMRRSVMLEGQPLFSLADEPANNQSVLDRAAEARATAAIKRAAVEATWAKSQGDGAKEENKRTTKLSAGISTPTKSLDAQNREIQESSADVSTSATNELLNNLLTNEPRAAGRISKDALKDTLVDEHIIVGFNPTDAQTTREERLLTRWQSVIALVNSEQVLHGEARLSDQEQLALAEVTELASANHVMKHQRESLARICSEKDIAAPSNIGNAVDASLWFAENDEEFRNHFTQSLREKAREQMKRPERERAEINVRIREVEAGHRLMLDVTKTQRPLSGCAQMVVLKPQEICDPEGLFARTNVRRAQAAIIECSRLTDGEREKAMQARGFRAEARRNAAGLEIAVFSKAQDRIRTVSGEITGQDYENDHPRLWKISKNLHMREIIGNETTAQSDLKHAEHQSNRDDVKNEDEKKARFSQAKFDAENLRYKLGGEAEEIKPFIHFDKLGELQEQALRRRDIDDFVQLDEIRHDQAKEFNVPARDDEETARLKAHVRMAEMEADAFVLRAQKADENSEHRSFKIEGARRSAFASAEASQSLRASGKDEVWSLKTITEYEKTSQRNIAHCDKELEQHEKHGSGNILKFFAKRTLNPTQFVERELFTVIHPVKHTINSLNPLMHLQSDPAVRTVMFFRDLYKAHKQMKELEATRIAELRKTEKLKEVRTRVESELKQEKTKSLEEVSQKSNLQETLKHADRRNDLSRDSFTDIKPAYSESQVQRIHDLAAETNSPEIVNAASALSRHAKTMEKMTACEEEVIAETNSKIALEAIGDEATISSKLSETIQSFQQQQQFATDTNQMLQAHLNPQESSLQAQQINSPDSVSSAMRQSEQLQASGSKPQNALDVFENEIKTELASINEALESTSIGSEAATTIAESAALETTEATPLIEALLI